MRSQGDKIKFIIYWCIAYWQPRSSFSPISKWARGLFAKWIIGKKCGKKINIEHGAEFSSLCSIGDYSGIGINCIVEGPVSFGKYCMMGKNCSFYTRAHNHDRSTIMLLQGMSEPRPIIIGDDVWFGSNVTVLPGVKIGDGAIIGAGSIVTHDIPSYSIAAGNPAKVIKARE